MRHLFPLVVSYNRFVELEKEVAVPLALFIKKVLLGKCTGISFVDSTPLRVCRNQRIHVHKVFKGIAQRGKCSMGWFFGFKLHLICNEKGELLNFMITPGDVDDRKPLEYKAFIDFIYGKLVADKGYIFVGWSDGVTDAYRVDYEVSGKIKVTANFVQATDADPDLDDDNNPYPDDLPLPSDKSDKPSNTPQPSDKPSTDGNGSYDENNQYKDGEHNYKDDLKDAKQNAQDEVNNNGNLTPGDGDLIDGYFDGISN